MKVEKVLRVRVQSYECKNDIERVIGGQIFRFIGEIEAQIKADMMSFLDNLPVPHRVFMLFERIDKGEEISLEFYNELWEDDKDNILKDINEIIDKVMA
jgi:hypothetical protein